MSIYHCGECRPDPEWSRRMSERIFAKSGLSLDAVRSVEINCGNGSYLGAVVLKDGSRVMVGGMGESEVG